MLDVLEKTCPRVLESSWSGSAVGVVGEERRRVQKLVEVMGLALVACGEGEDVSSVHTLLSGVVQVCHELLVGEKEEKEEEQGR